MSTNGQLVFTDVDKITFKGVGNASNAVIDTLTGKIGVGVDSPDANLHVVGNSYVSTNLELGGTLIMGTVNVEAQHSLEAVTATGNITPLTIEFTNPTTSLVASGNVEVGGDISISSNLKMNDVVFINANGETAVAVGYQAGETGQGVNTVAVGYQAGQTSQTRFATAVGNLAGQTSQSDSAVAIGGQAGQTSQGAYSVAVGQLAGASSQQGRATAVGYLAGNSTQGQDATAIGYQAGKTSQSTKAVAVGVEAGKTDQGVNAIAVGYLAGETDQGDNSIILNATGVALDSTIASSFHVKPVRGGNYAASALAYTGDGEIVEETNMHFDTAGNVGIGTSTPGRFLEVYTGDGTVPGIRLRRGAGSAYTDLHHAGVNVPGTGDLEGLAIITSDGNATTQEVMRICGNGNVGIGTSSPGQMLSIYTGSTTKPGLSIDRYSTGNYRTEFYQANTGLAIHVGNNTTAPNEKMRITHDGFVGIGTVSPSRTLDVHGAARPSGYPFAIGGTETNRARYVAVEVNPGNNKSSFTKDFVLGGHSRPGFVRVHAAGVASDTGALQWALYAEFTFSVYGTNTFSNRQSGDSGISIASSGTHNGIRVTINGGTNGSYPRAWIEVYSENNIYW